MEKDDLYAVIFRETSKTHRKELTQGEIISVVRVLQNMRDSAGRDARTKRTDVGGDPRTVAQRRKIYALCGVLGWNNDNGRINGFVKRLCGVERIEWLSPAQCYKVIEALKNMMERQEDREHG